MTTTAKWRYYDRKERQLRPESDMPYGRIRKNNMEKFIKTDEIADFIQTHATLKRSEQKSWMI